MPTFPYFIAGIMGRRQAQPLPTVGNDPDGIAFAINDQGQAVGDSGNCTRTIVHAGLWTRGTAFPLPDFGPGAVAQGINDRVGWDVAT